MLKKKLLIGVLALAFVLVVGVSTADAYSTLRLGSKGADVVTLQTKLAITADGSFGPMTQAAVKAFQTNKGLTSDGVVGPMTWAALMSGTTTTGTLPAGCTSTVGYSSTTGMKCDGTSTGGSDNGPLVGGAGDLTVTKTSTDVESEVVEGKTENVLGFKAEAVDSDAKVTSVKVTLENAPAQVTAGGSYRLTDYADTVSVYMGDTKVGSADASSFTKDGHIYSKSIALDNAVVRQGSSKKATFYVKVEAANNLDSTDVDHNSWNVLATSIRFQDATGVVMTADPSTDPEADFTFTDLAGTGDVKLTVTKGSSSPVAQNVTVSDTGSTNDVLLLQFKLKATGSDMTFDTLDVDLTSVTSNLDAILGEVTLKNGSDELASESTFDADLSQTVSFDLDDTFTIDEDSTETFNVYAKVNDVDNFTSGATVKADFADVDAEDSNGDVVTESGSAVGSAQAFVFNVPILEKVSATLPSTPTTHTDGVAVGEEDLYTATLKFTITAPEDNAVYVPLDTFAYGTAGTAGVQYTVTGGATIVSANVQYSGSDDLAGITEAHSYRIDAGESQQFTLSVVLKGNDAYGKVTMTGFDYETAEGTPNNSPTATISNFYTPSVLLAK